MEPEELIRRLDQVGVPAGRTTLARWVRQGLIPRPAVRSLGRGRGAESEYPPGAVGEGFASSFFLREHKLPPPAVAQIRRYALGAYDLAETFERLGIGPKEWVRLRDIRLAAETLKATDLPTPLPELVFGGLEFRGIEAGFWAGQWLSLRDIARDFPAGGRPPVGDFPLGFHRAPDGRYRLAYRRDG